MTVLFGSIFVGTTAVQGKVLKTPFENIGVMSGYDPGTSWISGNVQHVRDAINKFTFIVGPIEGDSFAYVDVMNNNLETGVGVGSGFMEIVGTWVGDDEFNGLEIYLYGQMILRNEGTFYTGWANAHGTLGDYSIHMKGDFITAFNPALGLANTMTGVLTIHL